MNIVLLAILLIYQTIMSILDKSDIRKYTNKEFTEKLRIKFYKETIVFGWLPVLVVFIFVIVSPLNLNNIGFRGITWSDNTWLNIITCTISGIMILFLIYQVVMYFTSANYRSQVVAELNSKKGSSSQYDNVMSKILIPKSIVEKKYYLFVSITAGICEEIVWRGCLIFLLSNIFPSLSIMVVCIISCILFGLAHCYQGIYGIVKTSVIAILFVMIYFTTNSLLPGIVLHFLFDYSSAFLIKEEVAS